MLGNIRITEYGVRVNLNLSEDFHMSKKQYLQQLSETLKRRFLFIKLAATKRTSSIFTRTLCSGIITAFLEFVLVSTCVFESIPTVNIKKIKW